MDDLGGNTPIFGNHPYVDDFWMKKRRISSKKQKDQLVVANTVGFLKDFWSQKNLAKVRKVRHNTLGFFDWRILVTCLKEEVQEFVLFITWKNWNQNNELETWQFDPSQQPGILQALRHDSQRCSSFHNFVVEVWRICKAQKDWSLPESTCV